MQFMHHSKALLKTIGFGGSEIRKHALVTTHTLTLSSTYCL